MFALLLAVLAACESPKSTYGMPLDGSARDDDGGSGVPRIALPGSFRPGIMCDGLGDACRTSGDCPGGFACAGANCVPAVDNELVPSCGNGSCPPRAPVCLRGICLTVDELACVCTNPESQPVYAQCQALSSQGAPVCLGQDALCDGAPNDCCEGLSCLRGRDAKGNQALGLCRPACGSASSCEPGGCCASAEGIAGSFCAPSDLCAPACGNVGDACEADPGRCCKGLVCVAGLSSDSVLSGCQKRCTEDRECDTGCCLLYPDKDQGVCAPATECQKTRP